MKTNIVVCAPLCACLLTGCYIDSGNGSTVYSSGYTGYTEPGYTITYGGYGPYFWTPRYYYYDNGGQRPGAFEYSGGSYYYQNLYYGYGGRSH